MSLGIVGSRIRERRRQIGVTQAEMARRIGISASYLNLIERNKRRIAGTLIQRTAAELGVSIEDLDGAGEQRLAEELGAIARSSFVRKTGAETEEAGELVGRFPGWARTVAALAQSEQQAEARARALAERLNHDPFIGETVHRMLTRISAVRSSAEILEEYADMSEAERRRFSSIILTEAMALSEVGEALAHYFDTFEAQDEALTPQDEVEALFKSHSNHFRDIDSAASAFSTRVSGTSPRDRERAALDIVSAELGLTIESYVDAQSEIQTSGGRAKAVRALMRYAACAALLPGLQFAQSATETRYDAEAIAHRFNAPVEAVLRRLAALPPSAGHPDFGYVRANASGTLLDALMIDGLVAPRHAPPCPLWVLFSAQRTPERMVRQRAVFTNGEVYLFVAKADALEQVAFGAPMHFETDMLIVSDGAAGQTVYGASGEIRSEDVGPACRICVRTHCAHRVEDPFMG